MSDKYMPPEVDDFGNGEGIDTYGAAVPIAAFVWDVLAVVNYGALVNAGAAINVGKWVNTVWGE